MNKIFGQLLSSHFIITFVTIVLLTFATDKNETIFIVGIISCVLYFYSGYYLTKEKVKWYNYFIIAFLGITLWLICFIISPSSMNYKRDDNAGVWFFYQLYIMVASPLNFIDSINENYSIAKQLILDLLIPIVISLLQFLGGFVKLRLKN